jgi:hypothetical protein
VGWVYWSGSIREGEACRGRQINSKPRSSAAWDEARRTKATWLSLHAKMLQPLPAAVNAKLILSVYLKSPKRRDKK